MNIWQAIKNSREDVQKLEQLIIENNITDFNEPTHDLFGELPLHWAWVQQNKNPDQDREFMRLFIERGADVNQLGYRGRIPLLMEAASSYDIDTIELLIKNGANINIQDREKNTALTLILQDRRDLVYMDIIVYLIEHGANANLQGNQRLPLNQAIDRGYAYVVKLLLEHGANPNPNIQDEHIPSPLTLAISRRHRNIVRLLIEHGADVNLTVGGGISVLTYAAGKGDVNTVKLLVEYGANVNHRCNSHGTTALMQTLKSEMVTSTFSQRYRKIIRKILVDNGANVDLQDNRGRTALMLAVLQNDIDTVKFLVEHGANIDLQDNSRKSALALATESKHTDIVSYLDDIQKKLNDVTTLTTRLSNLHI